MTSQRPETSKDVLVIGHAGKPAPHAITVDIDPEHNPDVVHDLNVIPWPFADNAFREVSAHHVLEHLADFPAAMRELHRVCRKEGQVYIEVPHHTAWFSKDPTHKSFFSYFSFDGVISGNHSWITGHKFVCLKREVTFHRIFRTFFLHALFNRFPMMYERFFCYRFPAEHVKVWLRPIK